MGRFRGSPRRVAIQLGAAAAACAISCTAQAQTNLITNGSFAALTLTSGGGAANYSAEFGTSNNGFTPTVQITGWTTAGYNFVFLPNTADTSGATGQYGALHLWGPNGGTGSSTYSNNGFTPTASPTGGNFIGADSAYEVSPISTTVNGLTPNKVVAISFAWAGAQQSGFSRATTEKWTVALTDGTATTTHTTQVISVVNHGFSGWLQSTFYFLPTSTSETLSFLATGTPSGVPPFALLANVSAVTVPEPTGLALMLSGLIGLVGAARFYRRGPARTVRR
ncbi:MAG: hypothetical protein B7Z80_01520 [Rhodospirillales bacterium 20-64-7]|nr:MAG: hypothetical protein B7Z80_01520 [Rhodospirillales bacterium 20-64-7]